MLDNLRLAGNTVKTAINSSNTNLPEGSTFSLPTTSYTNVESFTLPRANYGVKNTVLTIGGASSKAGVYYNYCAASAGTNCTSSMDVDGQYDLCPKGWRLPTGGASGEFKTLYNYYTNSDFMTAFRTIKAGYSYTSRQEWGTDGHWWSSTRYSATSNTYMKGLGVNSSNTVNPDAYSYRATAVMIRCILK
jgi:hypothetical protein